MKNVPVEKPDLDIRPDIEDLPWIELNKAENESIKVRERLAINEAKWTRQPIHFFPSKRGNGKYLSFSVALRGETAPSK